MDRQWQRKCWYLGKAVRNGAASDGGAHNTAAETVGHRHPAAQPAAAAPAPTPGASGASGDAGSNRECDIEQNVLNYRRVFATVFQSDATTTDVDAQAKELAAKGCPTKYDNRDRAHDREHATARRAPARTMTAECGASAARYAIRRRADRLARRHLL
jgi:hypothetical protein